MIYRFLVDAMEYFSTVWCSAADIHRKLLDSPISGARFLTGGVFKCDIAHRRSVAILCMLHKIRCNPVHPLNGALPGPYVPVRVTRGALVAHRYTYAPPRCRCREPPRSQCTSGTILLTPYLMVWDWRVSRVGPMLFYWPKLFYPSSTIFPYLFYRSIGWYCGAGVFGLIGCVSLSQPCTADLFLNNDNLVVGRSSTVNPHHGDLVLSGVSICASFNLDILGVKFDNKLTLENHVRSIVSRVSQRIGIMRLVMRVFVDTCFASSLLCICFPNP